MLKPEDLHASLTHLSSFNKLYVAYSGGIDSHVLLHLCAAVAAWQGKITAVYVNHGLQKVADEWGEHCANVARVLGLDFQLLRVNAAANPGDSPEESARNARYQALASLLGPDDVMLFAQHQDDQLETVLLQLFRGAGLQGLGGMPIMAALGQGKMIRPLLSNARAEIEHYAAINHLVWVEDSTNRSEAFDRNYLRHSIVPLMQARWPGIASTISRSARHCASAHEVLQATIALQLPNLLEGSQQALNLVKLGQFSRYEQRLLIREWLAQQGLRMPSEAVLKSIFAQVIAAGESRDPVLHYQEHQIRRYRKKLYCLASLELNHSKPPTSFAWPSHQTSLALCPYSLLRVVAADAGVDSKLWRQASISVSFRQGGEKISLPGRTGQHCLKKLFQEVGVPPWIRDRVPLIYLDGQLAVVGDVWISKHVWVHNKDQALKVVWQRGTDIIASQSVLQKHSPTN